ncbi:E3 ubiquitin-protein ligase at3g02290 [Phtheirospermum japonicum]|uniref:RING-type E3 ubiquitin transferase n=1 Tax=Phtheirospermum japonicum TaxID=374723 RepID=A0A830BI07_9LAMI|nr:E3 ubiquitin-protein ligase at3g02290 [Phtheirospermum japonicum]
MGFAHIYTTSEDEDVCPTCLEEYTIENPKIITKCSHHFHLGCIYEPIEETQDVGLLDWDSGAGVLLGVVGCCLVLI